MKLLLLLSFFSASVAAEPRPQITGVSSVRVANYGAPSTVVKERAEVADIVGELNSLRRKSWQRGETKLSCYSTLVLLRGDKRVGEFRIRPDVIVERPVEKKQASYSIAVGSYEMPAIAKWLRESAPINDKDCQ